MMLRTLHIYTFSQIDLQALGLLLLSGIACTLFAVFTSVIVKKPAVSLGLGMLFFLLPMLIAMDGLQTSWTSFFPSNFLSFRAIDQLMTTPWLAVLGNLYHRLPLLSVVWSFLCIVLIPVMIAKHSSIRSWSIDHIVSSDFISVFHPYVLSQKQHTLANASQVNATKDSCIFQHLHRKVNRSCFLVEKTLR